MEHNGHSSVSRDLLNPSSEPINLFPQLLSKLTENPDLLLQEGFSKWINDTSTFWESIDIDKKLSRNLEDKQDNISLWTSDGTLKFEFFEVFSSQLNLVILYTLKKELHKECLETLKKAEKLIIDFQADYKNHLIKTLDEEHLTGAKYLLRSVTILVKLLDGMNAIEEVEDFGTTADNFQNFETLAPKSQAFVFGIKHEFYWNSHFTAKQNLAIDQCLILDPDHWEWKILKSRQLRYARHNVPCIPKPNTNEKSHIEKAFMSNPNHPKCILRTLQYLGEVIKIGELSGNQSSDFPLSFGQLCFVNSDEVVKYLKKKALEFITEYQNPTWWMFQFGKLFSTNLPDKYIDRQLARTFFERAISGNPNWSFAHYKLGILMNQELLFNLKLAENHLSEACRLSSYSDWTSLKDLVRFYLRDLVLNKNKLKEIFSKEIFTASTVWPKKFYYLVFLKGYFHFLNGEYLAAMATWENWVNRERNNKSSRAFYYFQKLDQVGERFGWASKHYEEEAQNIKSVIIQHYRSRVHFNLSEEQLYSYQTLLNYVNLAVGEDEEYGNRGEADQVSNWRVR